MGVQQKFKFCFLEISGIFKKYFDLHLVESEDAEPADMGSQLYFFFVVRHLSSTLSNLQVCNTILLTVVTMPYIIAPEFVHIITGRLYSRILPLKTEHIV